MHSVPTYSQCHTNSSLPFPPFGKFPLPSSKTVQPYLHKTQDKSSGREDHASERTNHPLVGRGTSRDSLTCKQSSVRAVDANAQIVWLTFRMQAGSWLAFGLPTLEAAGGR